MHSFAPVSKLKFLFKNRQDISIFLPNLKEIVEFSKNDFPRARKKFDKFRKQLELEQHPFELGVRKKHSLPAFFFAEALLAILPAVFFAALIFFLCFSNSYSNFWLILAIFERPVLSVFSENDFPRVRKN